MTISELKKLLSNQGLSFTSIDTLLQIIDAPDPPAELSSVRALLPALIQELAHLSRYYPGVQIDPAWRDIASAILRIDFREDIDKQKKRPSLWGTYQERPVYVALWAALKNPPCQKTYLGLLGHVILASQIISRHAGEHPEYNHILRSAPTSVRKTAQPKYSQMLEKIATHCSPDQIVAQINASQLIDVLTPVRTLLDYFLEHRTAPRRESVQNVTASENKPRLQKHPSYLDAEQAQGTPEITIIQQATSMDSEEALLADGEIRHAPDLLRLSDPAKQNGLQTLRQSIWRTQRATRTALQQRNQRLPNSWHVMTNFEVRILFERIKNLIRKQPNSKNQIQPHDMGLLLAIMLFCGQPIESAIRFLIYPDGVLGDNPHPGLIFQNGKWHWVTVPCTATYSSADTGPTGSPKNKSPALGATIPCQQYLRLDFPAVASSLFTGISCDGPRRLFTFEQNLAGESVQAEISAINRHYHTRLTQERISHFLFLKLEKHPRADVTTAMFITGQSAYQGTVVAHYTAQRVSRLGEIYHSAWIKVFPDLEKSPPQTIPSSAAAVVGSPRVPPIKPLGDLIRFLKKKVQDRKAQAEQDPQIIHLVKLHNALTRYVAILVAYATGIRAVTSPMPRPESIDHETGFCILSDKDSADHYHTRVIWLPPICIEQLLAYWAHVRILSAKLSVLRPDYFTRVRAKRTKKLENNMMFLRYDGTPQEITPKILHSFSDMSPPCAFPENANRHLLRSWLLAEGCPPDIINAFLGHWFLGEEPWGPYSGLSLYYCRKILSGYLGKLLAQLGFEVITGLAKNFEI
jgi:integrase